MILYIINSPIGRTSACFVTQGPVEKVAQAKEARRVAHLCTILGAIERRRCSGANCEAMYGVAGVLPMRFFTRNWHPSRGWDVTSQQLEAIPWAPSDLSGQCSINRPDVPSQAPHRSRQSIAVQNRPDQLRRLKYPHERQG